MLKQILGVAGLALALAAAPAAAQFTGVQFEVMGYGGYTFSGGFSTDIAGTGERVEITPLSGFSYGASGGLWFNEYMQLGFLWSQQQSDLRVRAPFTPPTPNEVTFNSLKINNFHGFFAYHWGYRNAPAKPFFLFGMGATNYMEINEKGVLLPGDSRFSTTWGLGIKLFPDNGRLGVMFMGRWTPTYITSDPGGVWCDPYWGCSSYSNPKYSNQFDVSAGVSIRFGEAPRGF